MDPLGNLGYEQGNVDMLVLGVAFKYKPATNDIRHTPADPIIKALDTYGSMDALDPNVERQKIESLGATPIARNENEEITDLIQRGGYDIIIIANNNQLFLELDLFRAREAGGKNTILVDGWGLYSPRTVKRICLEYVDVG